MAKKLSITIAGAVSLGSYESGVAFEILDAVAQHNQWAATHAPLERIEIDVLTGASAGGMTVSMIAQRLLFDGAAMAQPYDNPLYNAWVKDIDITTLLARGEDEDKTHSVFSSDAVVKISETYLTARYATLPPAPPQPHAALPLDGKLQLGLALSNLNGVDYQRPTQSGGFFVYTDHADQMLLPMSVAADDRGALWETIRGAAVACGAFPVAFRVQNLLRNMVDYPSTFLATALWGGAPSRYFAYTDGGVFQNEPLGMAKNLVDNLPDGHLQADIRGYLFVAPHPKLSADVPFTTDANADPTTAFGAANANYKGLATRLASSVYGQSEFQDWAMAEHVNDRLRLLDLRAAQLQAELKLGKVTAAELAPATAALLPAFFAEAGVMTTASLAALDAARNQLRQQYALEFSAFAGDAAMADAWLDSVLLLEKAAGLHEKEEMLIYDFVADPTHLASEGLSSFGGFFDELYRKHDYDYGRSKAQQQLAVYQTIAGSIFANLHWTPKPIDPIDPALDNLDMTKIDEGKRKQVYEQISVAADALLVELNMNSVIRWAVRTFYLDKEVKKLLAL